MWILTSAKLSSYHKRFIRLDVFLPYDSHPRSFAQKQRLNELLRCHVCSSNRILNITNPGRNWAFFTSTRKKNLNAPKSEVLFFGLQFFFASKLLHGCKIDYLLLFVHIFQLIRGIPNSRFESCRSVVKGITHLYFEASLLPISHNSTANRYFSQLFFWSHQQRSKNISASQFRWK